MRQKLTSKYKRNEFNEQRWFADKKLSTTEEDFWLSGTNLGCEWDYVWMSTGRPVTVTNKWTNGQPDHEQYCEGNQKEHCMEINRSFGNLMNDDCCEKRQNYICEIRKINQWDIIMYKNKIMYCILCIDRIM